MLLNEPVLAYPVPGEPAHGVLDLNYLSEKRRNVASLPDDDDEEECDSDDEVDLLLDLLHLQAPDRP